MPAGRDDPWDGSGSPDGGPRPDPSSGFPAELLEGGAGPSWQQRWTSLPAAVRRSVAALGALVLLGGGLAGFRDWSAERALRQAVELSTTLGVSASSTALPGGDVRYFLLVRNLGPRTLTVTAVDASRPGLRLRMQEDVDHRVAAGRETVVPLSVRLTCRDAFDTADVTLPADLGIRRGDGEATTRRVDLEPAGLVLDVARTLCAVRPELRDHELSGPVMPPNTVRDGG